MSDHDLELLARVKADGRRGRNRRLVVGAGVLATLLLLGAIGIASIDGARPERVRVAAPDDIGGDAQATTTTTSTVHETTTTTKAELYAPTQDPPEETTTTTQQPAADSRPPSAPASATTRHGPSGLVLTITSNRTSLRSSEEAAFTLTVHNESAVPRTYNSSPGPRFALVSNGQQVWHDGCEMAYPAIFGTAEIAPGGEVIFNGKYPQTADDPAARERCEQPPGDYELTGIFQWCPNGDDECEDIAITPIAIPIVA